MLKNCILFLFFLHYETCLVYFSIPEELEQFNQLKIGFAGGLNPNNISNSLNAINTLKCNNFWLDLESGARTDNEFDLNKVKLMCEIVF